MADGPVTREELRQELAELERRLIKQVRDTQTDFFRTFFDAQATNEAPDRALQQTASALAARASHLEQRLLDIEGKLLLSRPIV